MFLGLRTVIYPVADLDAATEWWTGVVGHGPYFREPFYVGFDVAGYELGLLPSDEAAIAEGPLTYWGVGDADAAVARLVAAGCTVHHPVADVGDGVKTGVVEEPTGLLVGVIENPVFRLPSTDGAPAPDGPGR